VRVDAPHTRQLAGELIDSGRIARHQLEQDLACLDDPGYMAPSRIMWAAWGRRPETG